VAHGASIGPRIGNPGVDHPTTTNSWPRADTNGVSSPGIG
jgi:hypothetical protein